ncbi:uncharacterized protein LOC129355448 [Poeciliopsis prolifica]|uniref:uncharacterized protein LOC129355448 n=1 Tax=Poeciliopsis prolifica TaxID=188132 RepID=UPI002413E1BE|nr:uncharacterized protein LOC129355448 [Poeciliopsis prolifica]
MRTMKTMASLLSVCVFLLCCSAAATASQGCDQFVAVGGNFDVPLGYQLKTTDKILKWKFDGKIIVYKKPEQFITGKNDINDDGSLKLTNLNMDHEGCYTSEVFDRNGKELASKSTRVCVLDPVMKPTLNITCQASEVVFTCSHNPQPDDRKYDTINYKWFQNDSMISNRTEISMKRKVAETKNLPVSCEVGNKVSSARSDSLTHTCIEPVKRPGINGTCKDSELILTCLAAQQPDDAQYKWLRDGEVVINETKTSLTINSAESKNRNFSCEVYNQASSEKSDYFSHYCGASTFLDILEELLGDDMWFYIAGAAGLLLLIIILIIVCCIRCKKKRGKNDEAELQYQAGQSSSAAVKKMASDSVLCVFLLCCSAVASQVLRPNVTMKATASLSVVAVCLLCCSAVASQDCDQFAAVGGNFIVPLGYQVKPPDTLRWTLNGSLIFYKRSVMLITGNNDDINQDGSLKLTNLQKDQAGLYSAEVFDRSGRPQATRKTNLCVLDPVKKPEVKATCQDGNVIFHCVSGEQPADGEHQWLQNGVAMKENRLSFETKAEETKGAKFVCRVSNRLSSETSEPVIHNCAQTGSPDGINIWVLTGARVGFIVVLTVLVSVCFVRVERKMTTGLKADEAQLPLQRIDTDHHSHDPHISPLQSLHLQSSKCEEDDDEDGMAFCRLGVSPLLLRRRLPRYPMPLRDLGFPDDLCWGLLSHLSFFLSSSSGVVILLIIIVIVCCVRTKRTRKLRLQDEEELRLEWTITSQHPNHPPLPDHPPPHHPNRHHHHHHHHHQQQQQQEQQQAPGNTGPRQSRSKQNRQPRARAPEPNGQPQPSPRRTGQPQKPASDADDEQPPPLPQPRKKGPKTQLD